MKLEQDYIRQDGCIGKFFLDSGAHTIYTEQVIKKKTGQKGAGDYSYYSLKKGSEFRIYVDRYAAFIKKWKDALDYYATIDAIFNPKITYEVQKYLEDEHGLWPVPVIHYGTDLKWITKYLDEGHKYIGLGGLGQEVTKQEYRAWGDKVYKMLCPSPDYLPCVRTHGFAITAWNLLFRYPWYSVDSASWRKSAGFGGIYVPHRINGEFVFTIPPTTIQVSNESPAKAKRGKHIATLNFKFAALRRLVKDWLKEIDIPLGTVNKKGEMKEWGVVSSHPARMAANLRFFERMCASIPKWPWPFTGATTKTGLLFEKEKWS